MWPWGGYRNGCCTTPRDGPPSWRGKPRRSGSECRHEAVMIWRWVKHNFGWKLASLLAAVVLWVAAVGEPELVTIQAVPVLYSNLPKGLLVLSDAPDNVRAELRGPT